MFECQGIYLVIILVNTLHVANPTANQTEIKLSATINELNLNANQAIESEPNQEGFILLLENRTKSSLTSTCHTTTKSSMKKHLSRHLTRRSLHKIERNSVQTKINNDIDGFLSMNNEELSRHLFSLEVTADGSGETTESTSVSSTTLTTELTSTTSAARPVNIVLSNSSTFQIFVDCYNASGFINNTLAQFRQNFTQEYDVTYNQSSTSCQRSRASDTIEVFFTFVTENRVSILNDIVETLANILSKQGIELRIISPCGTGTPIPVQNVTSCYLIDLCKLCGDNTPRGKCLPEEHISRCRCFVNPENPSIIYTGDFCEIRKDISVNSVSSSWQTIVIAVLSGIVGFSLIITTFLLVMRYRSRSRKKNSIENQDEFLMSSDLTLSSVQTPALVPRSNSSAGSLLFEYQSRASLPSGILSLQNSYDPINELDEIIGYEDIDPYF